MSHRLSVNINDECAEALRRVTARRDISTTEAIRWAISLLDYCEKAPNVALSAPLSDEQGGRAHGDGRASQNGTETNSGSGDE